MHQPQQSLASHVFSVDRRKSNRSDVSLYSHIMLPGRLLMAIEIGNISESGLFARVPEPVAERTAVKIDLPGFGWQPAKVIWAMGDRHGFAFDSPLAFHTAQAIRLAYRSLTHSEFD